MLNINVCSYNMGSGSNDYGRLCAHKEWKDLNRNMTQEEYKSQYDSTQKKTAELLIGKANVYCLQEVMIEDRPLIESLKTKNFEIIRLSKDSEDPCFDTAIALDTTQFNNIENQSISVEISKGYKKDVAIATATHISSGQRIIFVSAHVPGFSFSGASENDIRSGDIYCDNIIKEISRIGNNALAVIGADMNANPEKLKSRFTPFSDQGLETYRTKSPTNVNPNDIIDKEREIDFIFTKTPKPSIWQKIKSIFASTIQFKYEIKNDDNPIGWDLKKNASDHLPIFINVSKEETISKINQLWNAASRLLSSCFRSQQLQTT